jgi:positive phototaxis protein PixI
MSKIPSPSHSTLAAAESPLARLQRLLPELFEPQQRTGDLYLRFQLGDAINAAISLEPVIETLQISASHITPIPQMASVVLGLMSLKGKIFWAVDLSRLMGIDLPYRRSQRHEIIVVRALPLSTSVASSPSDFEDELLMGLSVSRIRGTLRLQADSIVPIKPHELHCPPELVPFVQGQIQQGDETLIVLSVDAITQSSVLLA